MICTNSIFEHEMNSPFGPIVLTANDQYLTGLYFAKNKSDVPKALRQKTAILAKAEQQLELYFKGDLNRFDLPILIDGTPFQLSVWSELKKIQIGETRSYSDHAKKLKRPKAVRAVGTAIGKNPIGIIIPCHRVISKSGALGGFSGGLKVKRWLLKHEGTVLTRAKA